MDEPAPDPEHSRRAAAARHGRGLLVLGLLALGRQACGGEVAVAAVDAGRPIPLELTGLSGESFRLLPGVGPTLAARLEAARAEAGGVLTVERARAVHGVGPILLERWREAAASARSAAREGPVTAPEEGPGPEARRPP